MVDLLDDGLPPEGATGECIALERLEAFFVIVHGESLEAPEISYASGLLAPSVRRLELTFSGGGKRSGDVTGETFLALWQGWGHARTMAAFDAAGRELQRCKFEGDFDPC